MNALWEWVVAVTAMTAGAMMMMWLGELANRTGSRQRYIIADLCWHRLAVTFDPWHDRHRSLLLVSPKTHYTSSTGSRSAGSTVLRCMSRWRSRSSVSPCCISWSRSTRRSVSSLSTMRKRVHGNSALRRGTEHTAGQIDHSWRHTYHLRCCVSGAAGVYWAGFALDQGCSLGQYWREPCALVSDASSGRVWYEY